MATCMWDRVETDFGTDETGNFGPRQESGSALYEVSTIATIASREQVTECVKPHLSSTVIGEKTCVAANKHLSVFRDLQFCQTLEFNFPIDVMAWSPDEVFLVLGDSEGYIFFLEAESLEIIFSTQMLPPNKTGEKTFQKIIVRRIEDGYDIAILSCTSYMIVIRGATTSDLIDSSRSLEERFTIETVDTSDVHTKQTHSILFHEDNIVTLGSGANIIGIWSNKHGRLQIEDEGHSFLAQDAGIVSGYSTANNRFLVLLDEQHRLTVWDAPMLILDSVWEEAKVESFFLLEAEENKNSKSTADIKVVMLTNEGGQSCLQVKTLSTWASLYRLELLPSFLADTFPDQESVYFLEWIEEDFKGPHLRVRCLTEALPETRLTRLLNKNRFDEAMEFAKLFHLDTELIYKVKCNYLLDLLASWHVGNYQIGEVKEMTDNLHTCLAAIKDVPFIMNELTNVALSSFEDTHKILLYVKKRMCSYISSPKEMSDAQKKKCTKDLEKLSAVIYRLTTFKHAFGQNYYRIPRFPHRSTGSVGTEAKVNRRRWQDYTQRVQNNKKHLIEVTNQHLNCSRVLLTIGDEGRHEGSCTIQTNNVGIKRRLLYSAEKWERFLRCNLLEAVFFCLKQGDLAKALGIWTRHQHDWMSVLTPAVLTELLATIPEDVRTSQLMSWITLDLIPFILTSIPKALPLLLDWIMLKVLSMEHHEKDSWPLNAINFLKSVHQSGVQNGPINAAHKETTPSETVLKTQANVVESLQSLLGQIVKLEHLYSLQKKYNFYLTYNQFEQESTASVTFRMLDKVVAIELIASALEKQIRPYMIEHALKDDDIFFKYIKDLLDRSSYGQSYHGEAPWEVKAIAVIKYIKNPEFKCEAILDVMKNASLPWTAEIHGLVQSGLQLDHPKVELLKDQCSLTRMKEILLKYELKKVIVEDLKASDITRLINCILKKDQESSVNDSLEIIELRSLGPLYQVDLYMFRLRYLIQNQREGEALKLLRQLPAYLSVTCAKLLVIYTEIMLNEPIRFCRQSEEEQKRLFPRAGSKACAYLMETLKDQSEVERYTETKAEFENILALQLEFGEFVLLRQYQHFDKREIILKNLLKKIFSQNEKDKTGMSYRKVFRLADILKVRRARLLGQLAIHAVSNKQVDRAVELCNLLLECEATQETGNTLYEVTRSISDIVSDTQEVELLRKLPQVLHELACQASIICSPDLLVKVLSLCRFTDLSQKLNSQCESGDYSQSVQADDALVQEMYTVWNLDPMFKEDALVLDSKTALPLVSCVTASHLELVDFCNNNASLCEEDESPDTMANEAGSMLSKFATSTENLTSYLLRNGHFGLSLDYFQQMINTSTQFVLQQEMGYPIEDKIVRKVVDHQRRTLSELYPVCRSKIRELTSHLVQKVLLERRVDQRLGLAYLTSLPAPQVKPLLKKMTSSLGHNYKALMSIAQVGIALSELTKDPASLATFTELEQNATWGHRLATFKISFREAFMAPASKKTKLLSTMAKCEVLDISIFRDFCRAFQIEEDNGLLMYLDHLLLSPPPIKLDPETLQQQQAQLVRAKSAIQDITMKDQLRGRLHNLLEQINPYNYEVIQFILEEIQKLPPVSMETTEKGLKILKNLKHYRRCAPPTEYEIKYNATQESEELVSGIHSLHPLSKIRLPFHPVMSGNPLSKKVIKPELTYATVSTFTPMASLIEISSDSLYIAAIKNTVQQYLKVNSSRITPGVNVAEEKKHCNWELDAAGLEVLKRIKEMTMKITSCESAFACLLSCVIRVLPIGAEKVSALEQCVNYSEYWYKASPPDSPDRETALKAFTKFLEFYRRLSIEQVLYQTQMAEPDLLFLATNPNALIKKLYQHPTILLHDGELEGSRPDIHGIAQKIADLHNLKLGDIIKNLIREWLPGGGATEEIDATITLQFSNQDFAKDETLSENDECSLRRVVYLLQYESTETSCQFLYHYVTQSQMDTHSLGVIEGRVRALRCLLELADDTTIERICTKPASEIRERLQVLMYLVELEGLHIQHTVETFSECNKEGLVKGIWQNHSHKKSAVQLVADLCLDYQIYDVLLWNSLLQKLQAFDLTKKLENMLMRISGVKSLWQIPSLSKTWQDLLYNSLTKGVPPLQGEALQGCCRAINLLMKCPTPEELDLAILCDQCCRQDMYGCAISCALMMNQSEQYKHLQTVISAGMTAVLESLSSAETHGLLATSVRRVEEILFVYTELTSNYEEMYQSVRRPAFIQHLLQNNQIGGILEYLQQKNRLDEADDVMEMYLKTCPGVTYQIRLACDGKPARLKLQILMSYLDTGIIPSMNGSL